MVAERARRARLLDGLRRLADRAGDHHQRPVGPVARRLDRELEHRPVEPDLADRRTASSARRPPVRRSRHRCSSGRSRAADCVSNCAVGTERQRMRRDHRAVAQQRQNRRGQVAPVQCLVRGHVRHPSPVRARRARRRGCGSSSRLALAQGHPHVAARRRSRPAPRAMPRMRAMRLRHIDDERARRRRRRPRDQRQRDRLAVGHHRPERASPPGPRGPARSPPSLPGASSATRRGRAGAWRDGPASSAAPCRSAAGRRAPSFGRSASDDGPHRRSPAAARSRRPSPVEVPARDRDRDRGSRAADRSAAPARWRRGPATAPAARTSAMQRFSRPRAEPAAPAVLGHQHHADPGERLAERQHERAGLPVCRRRRSHAEAAARRPA